MAQNISMEGYYIKKVGQNKGAPRVWLEGSETLRAGFVPDARSASADILRNQLRDMGYNTHERVLNGKEWGAMENRNRWCMVAVTQGIDFDFDQLQPPGRAGRLLRRCWTSRLGWMTRIGGGLSI